MDWTQTLTIIFTIGASTAAVWYVVKEDMKLFREDIKRHDNQFSKMDERFSKISEEFSKRDTLWASLLEKMYNIEKQIYEIKLDQSRKS